MTTATASVTIGNELGLHARPAGAFADVASRFESEVTVSRTAPAETVSAKSMLSLLRLAAEPGTEITIHADGADAEEAVAALVALVEADFGLGSQ